MRTVPVKSPEQQALAMLFRTRELLLTQKTQLVNALRAHLAEHGVIVAGGRRSINSFIRVLDDMTNPLPHVVRKVGATYLDRIAQTAGEIEDLERQIDEQANEHEMAQRLRTIPGGRAGHGYGRQSFRSGHGEFCAWQGFLSLARACSSVALQWRQAALGENFKDGAARHP